MPTEPTQADASEVTLSDLTTPADTPSEPTPTPETEEETVIETPADEQEETPLGEDDLKPSDADRGAESETLAEGPQLDPKVFDRLKEVDPELHAEVTQRWDKHVKGLQEKETKLHQSMEAHESVLQLAADLESPEHYETAFKYIQEFVEKTHGKAPGRSVEAPVSASPTNDVPLAPGVTELGPERDPETGQFVPMWQRAGYDYELDFERDKAYNAKIAKLESTVAKLEQDTVSVREDRKAREVQAALETRIEKELPGVKAWFNREYAGFGKFVDAGTIKAALKENPSLATDFKKAVKATFSDHLIKHMADESIRRSPRGPEQLKEARGRGRALNKDNSEFTLADVLSERTLGAP